MRAIHSIIRRNRSASHPDCLVFPESRVHNFVDTPAASGRIRFVTSVLADWSRCSYHVDTCSFQARLTSRHQLRLLHEREAQCEARSLTDGAFDPDAALVRLDDVLAEGQPQSRSSLSALVGRFG